jgi:glycosyltransferase involved in cell wall biosynthesis
MPRHDHPAKTTPRFLRPRPALSVLIATRNRGDMVLKTIEAILEGHVQDLEILVIDQSDSDSTERALRQRYHHDERVRYLHDAGSGAGRARNLGLWNVQGQIVAITDDDCLPDAGWSENILAAFEDHPDASLLFGEVLAPPIDFAHYTVPALAVPSSRLESGLRGRAARIEGMSANMALRHDAALLLRGFDVHFGTGSPRWSAEDCELHYRALHMGFRVLITSEVRVLHVGIRTIRESWALWWRDGQGIGALVAVMMREGHPRAALHYWYWYIGRIWQSAAIRVLLRRKPYGLRLAKHLTAATIVGYQTERRHPLAGRAAHVHEAPFLRMASEPSEQATGERAFRQ